MDLFPNKHERNHLKTLLAVDLRNITNRMKGAINHKHYTVS